MWVDRRGSAPSQLTLHPVQAAAAPAGGEAKKLWGGRFTGATDPLMEKFNESLPFDRRMWAEDIRVRGALGMPRACGTASATPALGSFGAGTRDREACMQLMLSCTCGTCVPHVCPH